MLNGIQQESRKNARRRGGARDLPPDLVEAPRSGTRPRSPEVPVMGRKPNVDVPPPAAVPTLEEVQTLLAQRKLPEAARGLSALLGRCASDVPTGFALVFVETAASALRQNINGLRNGNRKAVKAALNTCVRRLSGELGTEAKKKLEKDLHQWGLSGTVDTYLR